jgi:hypothetical protein
LNANRYEESRCNVGDGQIKREVGVGVIDRSAGLVTMSIITKVPGTTSWRSSRCADPRFALRAEVIRRDSVLEKCDMPTTRVPLQDRYESPGEAGYV